MVLWTCDRCGVSTSCVPNGTPTQWWEWSFKSIDSPQAEASYELCDACDSAVRSFVTTGPDADQ